MTTDLDRTLRQAADSLLDSVAQTPAHSPRRSSRGAPVLVATAVLAVLAVAAATVAVWPADEREGEGDADADVAAQGPVEIPRLLADWLPAGYVLMSASDGTELDAEPPAEDLGEGSETSLPHQVVYGDAGAEDPFARSDLGVTTWRLPEDAEIRDDLVEGDPVTIRGQAGFLCQPGVCPAQAVTMTAVSWTEQGLDITLRSRSLDADQLLSLAEGLTIEGDSVVLGALPEGLPGPLDELAPSDDAPAPPGTGSTFVTYGSSDGTTSGLDIQTYASSGDIDDPLLFWSYDSSRRIEVRGHDGRIMFRDGPSECLTSCFSPRLITLTWEEAPAVEVSINAAGDDLTESDVLAIAESLRPATPEEWEAAIHLVDRVDEAEVASYIPVDAVASLTTSGLGGAAYLTADGQVCGFIVDSRGKLPDTCGDADERVHELRNRAGQVEFLFGTMPPGALSVAATRTGLAEPMSAFHDVFPEQGPTLYALTLGMFVPDKLTFLGEQAQPVETVDLDLD